jgi:hypothetical protein
VQRSNWVAAGIGAACAFAIAVTGTAVADGGMVLQSEGPTKQQALDALAHAQADINTAKQYIEAQEMPPPTTDPTTTPPTTEEPPPTTTVPPTTTTPPPPPSTEGVTAAAKFNWGTPVVADEFNGTGGLGPLWSAYDSEGHAGNGLRRPSAFVQGGGVVTVTGTENGVSGGAAMEHGQFRGKWEARMKVVRGDSDYHPVLLLWPDAEDWPVGGEVDFAEMQSTSPDVDFFLHFGSSNNQTHAAKAVDITQFHNYAVEWNSSCIKGYIDGEQFFSDCNTGHLPPRSMHATMQLDAFGGDSGYTRTQMIVDFYRVYK